jgi:uncharacterized integral membrane protein
MKSLTNLGIATIISVGIIGVAILSIQNAKLVKINWLNFQSIDLSWGLVMTITIAVGWLFGTILPIAWRRSSRSKRKF